MLAQVHKFTKNHSIVHLEQTHLMECKLDLSKAIKRHKGARSGWARGQVSYLMFPTVSLGGVSARIHVR